MSGVDIERFFAGFRVYLDDGVGGRRNQPVFRVEQIHLSALSTVGETGAQMCDACLQCRGQGLVGRLHVRKQGVAALAGDLKAVPLSSEERRVGKECVSGGDLGGSRFIKKKKNTE